MIYVSKANLPVCAETVLVGEAYASRLEVPLKKLGLEVLLVPPNPDIDPRLSSHTDLSVLHAGGDRIFLADYLCDSALKDELIKRGFHLSYPNVVFREKYPDDCWMNICCCGKNVILNEKASADEIKDWFREQKMGFISCRQGYAKCMVSVVNERSVICSDKGVSAACREKGIEVLEISQGFIKLDGFEYGFIGGSSFKISSDLMVFTGHLDLHPDRDRIIGYLESKGVHPVFLTDKPIFDVGSILPITEKQR